MCGCSSWNSACPSRPFSRCTSQVTLSGSVTFHTVGVSNVMICYTINGAKCTTTTNAQGRFCITASLGAQVVIIPQPGFGVVVTPHCLTVSACQDRCGLNFTLMPVCC